MADITSANVNYTINDTVIGAGGYRNVHATVGWKSGYEYSSGGVELDYRQFGFRKLIRNLFIMETGATGYKAEYDVSASTVRLFIQGHVTGASQLNLSSSDIGSFGRYLTGPGGEQVALAAASGNASTTYRLRALLELAASTSLNSATLDVLAIGH